MIGYGARYLQAVVAQFPSSDCEAVAEFLEIQYGETTRERAPQDP